jgi:hypothetical protein
VDIETAISPLGAVPAEVRHHSDVRFWLAALVAVALVPAALAATHPSVRLISASPARVAGSGFHPRERVLVTVGAGADALRGTVRSSARGAFVVRFAKPVPRSACGQLVVSAVGARGDRAAWKSPPPSCGAELQP